VCFSPLLRQYGWQQVVRHGIPVLARSGDQDTLCGTKVLWRKDWLRMERNLGFWGVKDLWGNYELLFGAGKLHLQIQEVPVHYQERIYRATKMTKVFSNGLRMLKICWGAWHKLLG
jgi:hypothetical protein